MVKNELLKPPYCAVCGTKTSSRIHISWGNQTVVLCGGHDLNDLRVTTATSLEVADSTGVQENAPTTPVDPTLIEALDKIIDTCLHPERNGLLMKEAVAEGANHEWLVKRELKTALTTLITKQVIERLTKLTDDHQIDSQDLQRQNPGYSTEVIPASAVYDLINQLNTILEGESK